MQKIFPLLALVASSSAAPIHGCEWLPNTVSITNFTYIHDPSNTSATDFVKWQAPAVDVSCNATNPSPFGFYFPCMKQETYGTFKISADDGSDRNATASFNMYAQCAADIFEIWYTGMIQLECYKEGESVDCGTRGNATASISATNYLPPIRNPPPPPHWKRGGNAGCER